MKLKQTITVLATALCIGAAAPLSAQVVQQVWIGRPTIGDHIRHSIVQAIELQRQAVKAKGEFNAQLQQARFDFFATARQPDKRADAEKRFANLLYAKDLVYMGLLITEGTGEQSRKRSDLMHRMTGGDIDGGIPEPAREAFDAWVNKVRANLGARNPNQPVFVFDQATLLRATDASADSYAAYKQLRDQFEFDRFNNPKTFGSARTAGANHPLHKAGQGTLDLLLDMRYDRLSDNEPLRDRLSALAKGGQAVLRCAYGPIEVRADGTQRYEELRFWFKRPPDDINGLIAADTTNGMVRMRTRSALTACPPTSDEAWAALGHPRAGSAGATSAGIGGGTAPAASPAAPRTLEETNKMAEQQRRQMQEQREASAARQREQYEAQRQRAEAQLQAQRDAAAARQQAQRDATQQRQCAAIEAQIERLRAQMQAMPPVHAARREPQLQAMERSRAERCG
jgi:hypothetical protein